MCPKVQVVASSKTLDPGLENLGHQNALDGDLMFLVTQTQPEARGSKAGQVIRKSRQAAIL